MIGGIHHVEAALEARIGMEDVAGIVRKNTLMPGASSTPKPLVPKLYILAPDLSSSGLNEDCVVVVEIVTCEENQSKVQPNRALNAISFCSGAREIATSVVSRGREVGDHALESVRPERAALAASFQSGANMKCCTTSWLRPANRSLNVCLPSGPSNTLSLVDLDPWQRAPLFAQPVARLVYSFSWVRCALRAAIHSSRETILCVCMTASCV